MAALIAATLLLAFAAAVTGVRRHRQLAAAQRVAAAAREWHRQVATELPPEDVHAWEATGNRLPVALLRGCAGERLARPGEWP